MYFHFINNLLNSFFLDLFTISSHQIKVYVLSKNFSFTLIEAIPHTLNQLFLLYLLAVFSNYIKIIVLSYNQLLVTLRIK